MIRRFAAVALAVLLVSGLAGCGDPIKNYCGALKKDDKQLTAMLAGTDSSALFDHLSVLEDLSSKAPDDITDDWHTFLGAIKGLDSALKAAGVKPSAYHDGKAPAGLTKSQTDAITSAADELSGSDVVAAASAIDQEAKDVCQIDLGV